MRRGHAATIAKPIRAGHAPQPLTGGIRGGGGAMGGPASNGPSPSRPLGGGGGGLDD